MAESERLWGRPRSGRGFDLMQIHNWVGWEGHMETLRAWSQEVRIRYIGITTSHGRFHSQFEGIISRVPLDFVQMAYNAQDR
ncbi:MAG: hypothetical protein VW268_11855 [Rhodospirillaceae bacterium]